LRCQIELDQGGRHVGKTGRQRHQDSGTFIHDSPVRHRAQDAQDNGGMHQQGPGDAAAVEAITEAGSDRRHRNERDRVPVKLLTEPKLLGHVQVENGRREGVEVPKKQESADPQDSR
jgi:hypothetical protein